MNRDDKVVRVALAVSVAALDRLTMTAGFADVDPLRAICGQCGGKGRRGAVRGSGRGKCYRCNGRGFTNVGKKRR